MDVIFEDCSPLINYNLPIIFEKNIENQIELGDILQETDNSIDLQTDPQLLIIFDQSSNDCSYISPNLKQLLGYDRWELASESLDFFHSIIHPEDLKVISQDIFKDILKFLPRVAEDDLKNLCFSFNYRMKHKKGSCLNILQSGSIFNPFKPGISMVRIATLTDISRFTNDDSIILKIEKMEDDHCQTIFSKYYSRPKEEIFTKKELEVLHWILKGFNSKIIAEKMFTSFHTIQTHRKHLLEKINAKNTADLIFYALKNGMVNFREQF